MGTHPIFESDFDCLTEIGYEVMILEFLIFGFAWSQRLEWRPKDSNDLNFTRLLVSQNNIYIGGKNQLLKLERNDKNIQLISKRDISKEKTNKPHPCCEVVGVSNSPKDIDCDKCYSFQGLQGPFEEENFVQNLLEVDNFILFCQNVNQKCSAIPKDDFQIAVPPIEQKELVSPLPQNPALVSVLEITDSADVVHKVVYVAKTNTYGTATCRGQGPKDGKCKAKSDTPYNIRRNNMKSVLVNFEIDPSKLSANKDAQKPLKLIKQIEPNKSNNQQTSQTKNQNFNSKILEEFEKDEKYPTMDYIDMFVAKDDLTELEWVYYVYTYDPVANRSDYSIHKSKGNFKIGRACIADTEFKNTAEIPLICDNHDQVYLAKFDRKNKVLVALMDHGAICKWKLSDFNQEFQQMAFSCWYWRGCSETNKRENDENCCNGTDNAAMIAKSAESELPSVTLKSAQVDMDPDSSCYVKTLTKYDTGEKKQCNNPKNGYTWENYYPFGDPGKCPNKLSQDGEMEFITNGFALFSTGNTKMKFILKK